MTNRQELIKRRAAKRLYDLVVHWLREHKDDDRYILPPRRLCWEALGR